MDISKPWPHKKETIDGIVAMQVFQQLHWRDLAVAFKESYRVLKKGGVMRFGTMLIDDNKIDYALSWNNINLFSFDLLERVLKQIGYRDVQIREYHDSAMPEIVHLDNRPKGKGTTYIEAIKWK